MPKKGKVSQKVHKKIKKEVNSIHKITSDFVETCIGIAKMHPKGLKRIKKHVDGIVKHISKGNKLVTGMRK
jgi:gas vesicle protein